MNVIKRINVSIINRTKISHDNTIKIFKIFLKIWVEIIVAKIKICVFFLDFSCLQVKDTDKCSNLFSTLN